MRLLRRVLRELWGLFVDDGVSAALILGWIGVACIVLHSLPGVMWSGPILFAGLATIVAFSIGTFRR